jgi:hypothetical protein
MADTKFVGTPKKATTHVIQNEGQCLQVVAGRVAGFSHH